jgi:hypothetical protein
MRQVSDYLTLLAQEHRGKPKFEATVSLVTAPMALLQQFLQELPSEFDLDTAIGVQLDIDGIWIGRSRQIEVPLPDVFFSFDINSLGFDEGIWFGPYTPSEGLVSFDDETYRDLLRAKVIANQWDGTALEMQNAYQQILSPYPSTIFGIIDNYDMSMSIGLAGNYPPRLVFYLVTGNYIPFKPEGVALDVYVTSAQGNPLFGLDVETSFISGLDVGAFGVDPSLVTLLPVVSITNTALLVASATTTATTVGQVAGKIISAAIAQIQATATVLSAGASGQVHIGIAASGNVLPTPFVSASAGSLLPGAGTVTVTNIGLYDKATIAGTASVSVTAGVVGLHLIQASATIAAVGTAIGIISESPNNTQAVLPNQAILASTTPGTAAPSTGPFDTWEVTAANAAIRNGVVAGTASSGVIALYYLNHYVYQVNTTSNSFGTPGWSQWNGSAWTAVANPTAETAAGTFGVYTIQSGIQTQTLALTGITLSSQTFPANTTNAVVGTVSVSTAPAGLFNLTSGSLSHSNTSQFKLSGTTLSTAGSLLSGSYSDTITATLTGASGSPLAVPFTLTAPPVVGPLTFVSATSGSVTFSYNPYPTITGSTLTIQSNTTSINGPYTPFASGVAPTGSYTASGLAASTSYYFEVAIVSGGVTYAYITGGPFSTAGVVAPGAVSNIIEGISTSSSIVVSWTAPTTGGSAVSYIVSWGISAAGPFTQIGTPTTASFTATGLSSATTYYFQIIAVGATNLQGPATVSAGFATQLPTAAVPNVVTPFTFGATNTAIDIQFYPPVNAVSGTAFTVGIQYARVCDNTFTTTVLATSTAYTAGTAAAYQLGGLTSNTAYKFRLNCNGGRYTPWFNGNTTAATGQSGSPDGTTVVDVGSIITDSAGHTWALVDQANIPYAVLINGAADTSSPPASEVIQMCYIGGVIYTQNKNYYWYSKTSLTAAWTYVTDPRIGWPASGGLPAKYFTQAATPQWTAMTYHGGTLLDNAQITYIFWGSDWNGTQTPTSTTLLSAMQSLHSGPYFAGLSEYFVFTKPTIANSIVYTTQAPPSFGTISTPNTTIMNFLTGLFTAGTLTPPIGDNNLYMIALPISAGNTTGMVGSHGSFYYQGNMINFGFSFGFANGNSLINGMSAIDGYTGSLAEQTVQAILNPGGGFVVSTGYSPQGGWYGSGPGSTVSAVVYFEPANFALLPGGFTGAYVNGVWAVGYYSNSARGVIIPVPTATQVPAQVTGVSAAQTGTALTVNWNTSSDATSYNVYTKLSPTGALILAAVVTKNTATVKIG